MDTPDPSYRLVHLTQVERPRMPVRVSLGCHYEGAALPVPDLNCQKSQAMACIKRVATLMPPVNRPLLRRLRRFCSRFCKRNFSSDIFSNTEVFDFNEWINGCPYPAYRKDELRQVFNDMGSRKPKKVVKSFVKDECYMSYKAHRGIYSRHDEYKVSLGPFFAKVGHILFSKKWFIKKIPVHLRPHFLLDMFKDNNNVFCTDFSQFEATFVRILLDAIECQFYSFLLSNNPRQAEIMRLIRSGIMGINKIRFKDFAFNMEAKRMSGEMNTSCGNGFFNMVLTMFILEVIYGIVDPPAAFEGDDGVAIHGPILPVAADYYNFGAIIKIEKPERLEEASFCGLIFDRVALDNVCDPIEALVSFGYTNRKYCLSSDSKLKMLLRSKSLSMLYTYPGCPMLRELGLYGLRITNDVKCTDSELMQMSITDMYTRELYENLPDREYVMNKKIHINTRYLVESKYKIPVQVQIDFETYLHNKMDLSPIVYPMLQQYMHADMFDYYFRYKTEQPRPKIHHDFIDFTVNTDNKFKIYRNPNVFFLTG